SVQDLTGQTLRCTIVSGCNEVLTSPYAHIGAFPLAALGAIAYFTVFSLSILAAFGYGFTKPLLAMLIAAMFLTTLWLLYLQAFVIHHFCQYCLLSAAVTTILTVLVLIASRVGRSIVICNRRSLSILRLDGYHCALTESLASGCYFGPLITMLCAPSAICL